MLLPLDSPHWNDLTACQSAARAVELLRQIVSTGRLGEAWRELHDEIIHQGSVYGVSSAALPHLIRLAPSLTPDEQRDLWIEVGLLIIAGADSFDGNEPVPGMQETLTRSLCDAEPLALRAFPDAPPLEAGEGELLCFGLRGPVWPHRRRRDLGVPVPRRWLHSARMPGVRGSRPGDGAMKAAVEADFHFAKVYATGRSGIEMCLAASSINALTRGETWRLVGYTA
jgi:hypothetical protein